MADFSFLGFRKWGWVDSPLPLFVIIPSTVSFVYSPCEQQEQKFLITFGTKQGLESEKL